MKHRILTKEDENERVNNYYLHFLSDRQLYIPPPSPGCAPEDYIRHIRKHWSDLPTTFTDTEMFHLLDDMRQNCRQSLLPLEIFSWLESSERACFFGWHKLMDHLSRDPSGVLKELPRHNHVSIVLDDYLSKNKYPSNARGQLIQIIRVLDLMSDRRARNELLEEIKQSWIQAFKIKTPFKELSAEDNDECQWTWDQLKKENIALDKYSVFSGTKEIFNCIHLSFDIWCASPFTGSNSIKLFRLAFNRAKAQRKYKNSKSDKISLQVFIDFKTREKLKLISRNRRLSAADALQEMIEEEFKRISGNNLK
ncbi:TPA: hypothetical protein ACPY6L_004192 [Yersinia enterocolitica]